MMDIAIAKAAAVTNYHLKYVANQKIKTDNFFCELENEGYFVIFR
jgi:hypothetical protein